MFPNKTKIMGTSEIRAMKNKFSPRAAFLNLRVRIGLVVSLTCGSFALLTLADSANKFAHGAGQSTFHKRVEASTVARVTSEGVITENLFASQVKSVLRAAPERLLSEPR